MILKADMQDPEVRALLETGGREDFLEMQARFRGEIWENSANIPMERGYGNNGKPFDIASAGYLRPVQMDIRRRPYGKFAIKAAVQTLKTFGTIEDPAAYFIAHDPGDMTIYLCGDDKAFDQAKGRLMPRLRGIPSVGRMIADAESFNRHDVTTAEIYLPGMILRVWGLNESTTQRITLRYVFISDAFLAKRTGLIKQAIARTTAHNSIELKDYKIVIESQGGETGDDFDTEWNDSNQGVLSVHCPTCGTGVPFLWHLDRSIPNILGELGSKFHHRNDDLAKMFAPFGKQKEFRAIPPLNVPSLDWEAWSNHWTPLLLKPERCDAGMKRGPDELIKLSDGGYNAQAVMNETYYECYWCGGTWRDTPRTRRQLDDHCYYTLNNPTALPENIGYTWPAWAGQRIPWGGEFVMWGYLDAKKKKEETGNEEPLKQWYQKRAAQSWDPKLLRSLRARISQTYDIKSDWPEEYRRCLIVDCQQDLQYFWASVWAVSETGKSRQLWRGILRGFGEPSKEHALQPDTVQGKQDEFGIKDSWVFLDARYMKRELVDEAVKHGHWGTISGERDWFCWTLLLGSPQKDFAHKEDENSKVRHPVSDAFNETPSIKIGKYSVKVEQYYFSALQTGDMFARYRDGGGPETLFLPEEDNPDNKLSWTAQIHAVTREVTVSKRDNSVMAIWKPPTQSTPHHYWDIGRMFMAVHMIWGIAGYLAVRPPGGQENHEKNE